MRTFDYSYLADRTWDNEILSYISKIHEYKGKQELYLRQKPVELTRLIEIAKIQSTEASNRIEGIITTNSRLKQLVADKTTPRNRDEEEILGYRNVLNLVHENYDMLPIRSNYILQMHRDLLKYTSYSYGGQFKTTPNEIDMLLESGEKVVLFKPLEPYETPDAINMICESYSAALKNESVDELILIPCFLLDFLCIHPFNDGNGRMSRLLTLLLLCRCGYMVGQYISIEKAIADTKEAYYDALQKADQGWHEGTNDPKPFIKYMLGIILSCYREFENRVNVVQESGTRSTSYDIVKAYVEECIGKFSKQEVLVHCPSLGSSSVESALKKLAADGTIVKIGAGRNTRYVRADALDQKLNLQFDNTISTFLTKRTEIKYNTIIKICNALEINAGVLTNHDIPNVDFTMLSDDHMTLIETSRTLDKDKIKIILHLVIVNDWEIRPPPTKSTRTVY